MPFISVTRLRVRRSWFLPGFLIQTLGARQQVSRADGFLGGRLLADRRWTFWTLTMWDTSAAMRAYMTAGAHKTAMPKLLNWCDEASVVHWDEADANMPSWPEADEKMRQEGRPSKVLYPSTDHALMRFAKPRIGNSGVIRARV